jgi:hypothetical protein
VMVNIFAQACAMARSDEVIVLPKKVLSFG